MRPPLLDRADLQPLDLLPIPAFLHFRRQVLYANLAAQQAIGYTLSELRELDLRLIVDEASLPAVIAAVTAHERGEEVAPYEYTYIRKDGKRVAAINHTRLVAISEDVQELARDASKEGRGAAVAVLGVVTDVDAVKQAERALKQSENLYRLLVETCPDVITLMELDGRIIAANRAMAEAHGLSSGEELIERCPNIRDLIGAEGIAQQSKDTMRLLEQGVVRDMEYSVTTLHGQRATFLGSAALVREQDGTPKWVMGIARDITETRELLAQNRALGAQVIAAQEEERVRIARELHDVVGQMLAVLKMDAAWICQNREDSQRVVAGADQLCQRVDEALTLVREMAYQLRPAVLDDLGLASALETLAAELNLKAGHPSVEVVVIGAVDSVPGAVAVAFYRIAQEAITNAIRHAQCDHVSIRLQLDDDGLMLIVADDGVGITDERLVERRALGLASMRERAQLAGGLLKITRRANGGTVVSATVPQSQLGQLP
ncbi:MAG: PAS domain S-box protein [Deltaproteobacteria bacterium]|nr:PAS domain S-box protein [Deltaproteobacteria bacterium]